MVAFYCGLAGGADLDYRVGEVREAAGKLKSFRVEFLPPPSGEIALGIGTGILTWAPPFFHRLEVDEPVSGLGQLKRVTICDGKTVWSYVPNLDGKGKQVAYKIDLGKLREKFSDEVLLARGVLIGADPFQGFDLEKVKFVETGRMDGVDCLKFEVPPPVREGKAQSVARMTLMVGVKDGIVREQETFSALGDRLGRRRMKVLATDFETTAKDFAFTPPEGCEVVDVTEKVLKSLER
jgi:outer membrane lipoprotein-sorting protein